MDCAIDQISSSLKDIQTQLNKLNEDWDGDKNKTKPIVNAMIAGIHSQVGALGGQLEKLIKSLKNSQRLNCKIGEEARSQGRSYMDYLDDLDQRSLMGKIAINVQDPEFRYRRLQ